jgi:hypothetical protein
MSEIERSAGLVVSIGTLPAIVGGGYSGRSDELDATVQRAAEMLRDAYGLPVVIRFNSDRLSGGAWLKTHEVDGIGRNSEIGLCASENTERTEERYRLICERSDGDMIYKPRPLGVSVQAHISVRSAKDGIYYHCTHESLEDALAYVLANAELREETR